MMADCNITRDFELLLKTYGCSNVINTPTRITCDTSTCLDLFITNYGSNSVQCGTISYSLSDHMPVFLTVKRKDKRSPERVCFSQIITEERLECFRDDLSHVVWDSVVAATSADRAYGAFLETFISYYVKHFPSVPKVSAPSRIRKPWVTVQLFKKIKEKARLFNKFIISRDPDDLRVFKSFRNGLTKELRAAKTAFYKQSFASCSHDSNKIWHWLNSLLNRVPNSTAGLRIISDGADIPDEKLADCFNNYFTNLPKRNVNENACRFITTNCVHSILLRPTNTSEVILLFSALNNSNSCDADNIKIKPVKFVIDIIAPVLAHIYNICLSTGVFPYKMQMAKVVALLKKGDKTALPNYRPVYSPYIFEVLGKNNFLQNIRLSGQAQLDN